MSNTTPPSTVRPQGRVDLDRLASAVRIVAGLSRRAGLSGRLSIDATGLSTYQGKPISAKELDELNREAKFGVVKREDIKNGEWIDLDLGGLDEAAKLRPEQLPELMQAEICFTIYRPDGRADRAALVTATAPFPLTITVQLTDDEAKRLREDRYGAMRLARVQKRLADEEENTARHKAKVERHAEFLLERSLASRVWTNEPEWRVEELDGTFLRLSYTPWMGMLIAFTRPIDLEDKGEDCSDIEDAVARVVHLAVEVHHGSYEAHWSLPDDADEPMGILAREHQRSRDGAAVAAGLELVDPARLIEAGKLFERARFNVERVEKLYRQREGGAERERPAWLVEGLLPQGEVVMLAGEGGAGKSTLMHELAVAVATPAQNGEPAPTWLGRPIDQSRAGDVLFLTMEESEVWFGERGARLDPLGEAESLVVEYCDAKDDLARTLDEYGDLGPETGAPRLVVVDSASKFRHGSELNDADVNAFFEPLERFARRTKATVAVIHHLNKPDRQAKPIRTAAQLRARVSGHMAFVNRPRLALGMFREGEGADAVTRVGVIKENCGLGHLEGIFDPYRRDPESYRHLPAPEPARRGKKVKASRDAPPHAGPSVQAAEPAPETSADDAAERIMTVLTRIVGEGGTVTTTGPKELHAHKVPELAGLSRAKLRAVMAELVATDRVQRCDNGALVPVAAEPAVIEAAALAAE